MHTLETGSGFPTRSYKGKLTSNNEEYLDSPWNLNNLSRLDKSVLSQMNVDISGMKVIIEIIIFINYFGCINIRNTHGRSQL